MNPSLIFIMFKLSKSIGRMKIKVGNKNKEIDRVLLLLIHIFLFAIATVFAVRFHHYG